VKRLFVALLAATSAALALGAGPAPAAVHTKAFDVPAKMDPYEVRQTVSTVATPRTEGFITGMSVNVVDKNGAPVPIRRLMLHHIVFAAVGRPDTTCQGQPFVGYDSRPTNFSNFAQPFYGAGEERNVLALPKGYGYPIHKNDIWGMVWMLMNHRGVTDSAFIRYTVTWQDASDGLTAVTPYWLDENNCRADPIFNVPGTGGKHSTYKKTYDFTMPESGRIVAGGGHVHGGAYGLTISEPDCSNRTVFKSSPAWGMPSNPFYHVRPILHEPGPISMSGYLSQTGYPIAAGQRLRLTAAYDNSRAHTRVMGISLVYVAPQAVSGCAAPPTDGKTFQPAQLKGIPFRTKTPVFKVPLTGIGADGKAHTISRPAGRTVKLDKRSSVKVRDYYFAAPNASVAPGSTLTWDFGPATLHNVTLANGPQGFASFNLSEGRRFKFRFTKPGTYRIFCALHPVLMTETVTVRPHKRHKRH